jgi:rhamnosyltransferase
MRCFIFDLRIVDISLKYQDKMKVAVLIATYNGEDFIMSQIDSIEKQVLPLNVEYNLYIHDDGSTDNTMNLISDAKQKYKNIEIVGSDNTKLGIKKSIYLLLKSVVADVYFFADQDDVWFTHKVETMLSKFSLSGNRITGVYSDLLLVDVKNKSMHKTMRSANHWESGGKRNFLFLALNPRVTGAALAINLKTRNAFLSLSENDNDKITMHDSFIANMVGYYDGLHYIDRPLVSTRTLYQPDFKQKRQIIPDTGSRPAGIICRSLYAH